MKKKTKSDMPIGRLSRMDDFLPPPDRLALPENTVKVTLQLKRSSIEFFKHEAEKNHTKYQRMIRELVDRYATHYFQGYQAH